MVDAIVDNEPIRELSSQKTSYTNNSFDVSGEDSFPTSITWNDTGTKLFMLGESSYNVYEYTASTAYDLTTLSYTNNSFDVSGEDSTPNSITWNDTGTKLFMLGEGSTDVYEYTASTAYDVTTLSYTNNSFDVNGQDRTPTSITWNDTGTKLFMLGSSSNAVYEYTTAKYALGKTIEVPQGEVWKGELSNINKVIFNDVEITPPTNLVIANGDVLETSENALFTGFRVK